MPITPIVYFINLIYMEINIGIFGCVSVGKSTLLNAITGQQYSDTEIKKTTMTPQAYLDTGISDSQYQSNPQYQSETNNKSIRNLNRTINNKITQEIANKTFSIDKCQTTYHHIDKICDLIDPTIIDPNININIYDTPGLNDSASKDIYFEWVKQNISIFDIIIFVTDITRGLNDSDEIEVLHLLFRSMKLYGNKMICVMNKCDDIYYDRKLDDLFFEDTEQENIYIQANNILTDIARSHNFNSVSNDFTPFFPVSAENCFIYRILLRHRSYCLDDNHQNRICKNECGLNRWKAMGPSEKNALYQKILSEIDTTFENKIQDTGYLSIKNIIQLTIINNKHNFLLNRINAKVSGLQSITDMSAYVNILTNVVEQINQAAKLGLDITYDRFWSGIKVAMTNYIGIIDNISTRITVYGDFIKISDFDLLHATMQSHCMNFKMLKEVISTIKDYPADFVTSLENKLYDKFFSIYENIASTKFTSQLHTCPTNIQRYLEISKIYVPSKFDYFSIKFLKRFAEVECKHQDTYPDEFINMISYISANIDVKNINIYLSYVCKILFNRQLQMRTKIPSNYLSYLVKLKKLVKYYGKICSTKPNIDVIGNPTISPLDIFYEVICKTISTYIDTNCVTSIYRQDIDYNKIIGVTSGLCQNLCEIDMEFESNIISKFVLIVSDNVSDN